MLLLKEGVKPSTLLPALAILALAAGQYGCSAASSAPDSSDQAETAAAEKPAPAEDIFRDSAGWKIVRDDGEYFQRSKIIDDGIYCETQTTLDGSIDAALAL